MKTSIFSFRIFIISLVIVSLWGLGFFLFTMKNPWNDIQQDGANSAMPSAETIDDYLNNPENNKDPDFMVAKNALENGDIKNAPILWEKIVKKQEDIQKLTSDDILKPKIVPRILLAQSYLQYGNYYHKEKEYADKAIQIISKDGDDDYGAHGMYFVGYAYEITKQYDKALEWYEKGLKVSSNTDKLRSIFQNQIGHVYDLMWDTWKAFDYYTKAYELNNKNLQSATNLWRMLVRVNRIQEAIPYLEYASHTPNLALKSEIYYTLSSVELERGWLKPDMDKSIIYAKASIKAFPDYPMWYVALARWLYMKNNKKHYEEIGENLEKSIGLNPNGYYAYELSALNAYDNGDFKKSIDLLQKAVHNAGIDMILMDNERTNIQNMIKYKIVLLTLIELAKKDGNISISQLWEKLNQIPFWKDFIKLQIKRDNYGILNTFAWVDEYIKSF